MWVTDANKLSLVIGQGLGKWTNIAGAVIGLVKGYGTLNEGSPSPCNRVHGAANLVFISQFRGCMNTLGASLVGEATGYMGRGSPPNGPYSVDTDEGANPVMHECSLIGTSRDHGSTW